MPAMEVDGPIPPLLRSRAATTELASVAPNSDCSKKCWILFLLKRTDELWELIDVVRMVETWEIDQRSKTQAVGVADE